MHATEAGVVAEVVPLRRFALMQDAELEALAASAPQWSTPCRITAPTRHDAVARATAAATSVGPLKLVYAQTVGTEVAVDFVQQESNYVVTLALSGRNLVTVAGETVTCAPRQAVVLSPRMVAGMHISDGYQQLHIAVERRALEQQLEAMTGRPVVEPIRFGLEMDFRSAASMSWARAVRLLLDDLDRPDGLTGVAPRHEPWSSLLMTGLLLAQPHNYSDRLREDGRPPFRPRALRRTVDLIHSDPAADLSLARLCEVAGSGPRALQRHFQEYFGCSPLQYVQRVRLEQAHSDLLRGRDATVADVAHRWGFTHVPRFAGAYRDRYGVAPSVTLRA